MSTGVSAVSVAKLLTSGTIINTVSKSVGCFDSLIHNQL